MPFTVNSLLNDRILSFSKATLIFVTKSILNPDFFDNSCSGIEFHMF
ncbi:MAG: hypothetical protein RLZZ414_519 [Bacteroidota bacterium]|jgi:hypothetical protein